MTEKEFTELAHKHLVVLESYQKDENGNSQFNIFGYKHLYEAINDTHCCESDSEQLCDEGNLGKIKKLYTKVGNKWVEYKKE